jgi:hypothetical protein
VNSDTWYWAREAGKVYDRPAAPEHGYAHDLTQARDFDPVGCRFVDRWWPADAPERALAQTIRCYSPADLLLLLEGTGLALVGAEVRGQPIDPSQPHTAACPLWGAHEYRAVLGHAKQPPPAPSALAHGSRAAAAGARRGDEAPSGRSG